MKVKCPREQSAGDDDEDVDGNLHRHRRPKMLLDRGTEERLEEDEDDDRRNPDDETSPRQLRQTGKRVCQWGMKQKKEASNSDNANVRSA